LPAGAHSLTAIPPSARPCASCSQPQWRDSRPR
jgi:hypothetical protein